MDFAVLADQRVKLEESEKRDKYLDLVRELEKKQNKKTMEHEGDGDTCCNWYTWSNPQRISKGTGRIRNEKTRGD